MFTNNYLNAVNRGLSLSSYSSGSYTYYSASFAYNWFINSSGASCGYIASKNRNSSVGDSEWISFVNKMSLFTGYVTNDLDSSTNTNSNYAYLGFYVANLNSLSPNDYEVITTNKSKVSVSRNSTSGEYSVTVLNNTSADFTFNTIQIAVTAYTTISSSQSVGKFLLAELDVGTITLAPSESKTFSIRKENLAQ